MAAAVDGALLIFRASAVPGAPEASLVETMRQAGIRLLGVVLNDARAIEPDRLTASAAAEPADDRAPAAFAAPREAVEARG